MRDSQGEWSEGKGWGEGGGRHVIAEGGESLDGRGGGFGGWGWGGIEGEGSRARATGGGGQRCGPRVSYEECGRGGEAIGLRRAFRFESGVGLDSGVS